MSATAPLPRVSAIIPVFNNRTTVLRAVESALAQQGVITEVIVVDDGSTDGSVEVLEPVRERIRIVGQLNGGPGAARNRGMKDATGDYIAFLDADDYWLQGLLRATSDFLQGHPECGAVSTAYYRLEAGEYFLKPRVLTVSPERLPTGVIRHFFNTYTAFRHVCTGTVLLRRTVVERCAPMRADLRIAEDIEYWLRLATATSWGFVAKPYAVYDGSSAQSLMGTWVGRQLLPDVEHWQSSILPLLNESTSTGFESFRSVWLRDLVRETLASGDDRKARDLNRSPYIVRPRRYRPGARVLNGCPPAVWLLLGMFLRYREAIRNRVGKPKQPVAFRLGEEPWRGQPENPLSSGSDASSHALARHT